MLDHVTSLDTSWLHPDDESPPRNKKILLYLNTGIALIGLWRDDDCLLWMPLPKVSKELKLRIETQNKDTHER